MKGKTWIVLLPAVILILSVSCRLPLGEGNTDPSAVGGLNFTVGWPSGRVDPSAFTAGLISPSGSTVGLDATVQDSFADVADMVDAGTWVLTVRLGEGSTPAAGYAEVVWIDTGRTTSFSSDIDIDTGEIAFDGMIGNDPETPVSVSISGLPAGTIPEGESLTVTAEVSGSEHADITWYLNGVEYGTGGSRIIDGLSPGGYTLSAVAFEPDGPGAASENRGFVVSLRQYTLTVNSSCGGYTLPAGAVTVVHGEPFEVEAVPDDDDDDDDGGFTGWIVEQGAGNITLESASSKRTTVTLIGNATIRAGFESDDDD